MMRWLRIFPVLILIAFYSCTTHKEGKGLSIKWSTKVDSLLHDTAKAGHYADSIKQLILQASTDKGAINQVNNLADAYTEGCMILADEAIQQSSKLKYTTGIAEAYCKRVYGFTHLKNWDSAMASADKALVLAQQLHKGEIIAEALSLKGTVYDGQNNFEKANDLITQAIKIAKDSNFKNELPYFYRSLARSYTLLDNFNESLHYDTLALPLFKAMHKMSSYATTLNSIGVYYGINADYAKAMGYLKQALNVNEAIKDLEGITDDLSRIGSVYYVQDNFTKALEYYSKTLQMSKVTNNEPSQATALENIGLVYQGTADTAKAVSYFQQSLILAKKVGRKKQIGTCLKLLGEMAFRANRYDTSLIYYRQGLDIARSINSLYDISTCSLGIGSNYSFLKNYDSATVYLDQSVEISKKIGDKMTMSAAYMRLGYIALHENKITEAKKYADLSYDAAKEQHTPWAEIESGELLSETEEKTGDYKNALELFRKTAKLHDSIFNNSQTKKLNAMELKTKEDQLQYEHEKQKAVFDAEQEKKEAELKRQKTLNYAVTIGFILLLVLAVVIFRNLQQNKKKTKIISEQKVEVEKQKELVETKNKEILDSITYAKRLQEAILPPLDDVYKALPESFVLYLPKDIVAGDFYWMYNLPLPAGEGRGEVILIAAADCTGHGVPGALVSVVCSNALNRSVKEFNLNHTNQILDKTRELVLETFEKSQGEVKDGMDASLACLTPSNGGMKLEWSGAYNPLWYISNGEMKEITADKQPIGKTDSPRAFSSHSLQLNKGDTIYLFTDGYADQFGGPKGKKFKYKQLQELLLNTASMPISEQKTLLEKTLAAWKGDLEQVDDILIIGIRV